MFLNIHGTTQSYLADLAYTQNQMNRAQSQISSGLKVQTPADDPGAVAEILQVQAQIGQNQQVQTNLGAVSSELGSADSVLQSAVTAVQNAITLAAQGANSNLNGSDRANIATQVQALQETLVGISQTVVNGRYIFSGDQDTQPAYHLDPTQPNGVKQLTNAPSTRQILDAGGAPIAVAKTAQDIFDNANGSVFAAIQSLITALQTGTTDNITQASTDLKTASGVLNQQLAFYGETENRITTATGIAQRFQTAQEQQLSTLRDADIPTVAVQLNQEQVTQQASIAVEAQMAQVKNLFSLLG